MSQPKVFEYAKEIGFETLALMTKIREWGLPVKSHMVELDEDLIEQIQEKLKAEVEAQKATKKKVTRKKAAKKKTATKKTAKKKVTTVGVKKTAAKKTVTKKSATVIRRKKAEETPAPEVVAAAEEVAPTPVVEQPTVEAATPAPPAEAVEATPAPAEKVEETAPAAETEAPKAPSRKVAVNVASGESSGVKSNPQPKNIIGRMDLSRVSRPQSKTGSSGTSDSEVRSRRTGTQNIRPGFVAAPAPGFEDPQADARKKFEEKKPGVKKTPGKEQAPASFSSTEFRKREMVFQPKKKKGVLNREAKKTQITTPKASKRVLKVHGTMIVSELAQELGMKMGPLSKVLIKNGVMVKPQEALDFDTISLIVPELGWEAVNVEKTVDELVESARFGETEADLVPRAPVVTIMGHVDHGKTTLLDTIRKANVVSGEAGGITQHIAAYRVHLDNEKAVTFIDTPGHAAFTAMRARGANVTDIVVIVVAADDGVMPQTVEAINHAKAAGVPIVVAVNKVDKPDANPEKIRQQLTEYELVSEEWGGDTIFCEVSALKGDGISNLLEQLHLIAEVAELKANPNRSGTGIVIEGRMEKGRGNVATILVQDGTIKVGQYIVAGQVHGKIRSLINDQGKVVKEATPSVPVEVLGLPESPNAGDQVDICKDEKAAEEIASVRREKANAAVTTPNSKMSLEDLFAKVKSENVKELPIVLKTDVVGSSEAIKGMFDKIDSDEVKVKIIHSAVGPVSESDVLLASSAEGMVIGFNVRPDSGASIAAKKENVEIKEYKIIYELLDDVKKALSGLLDPDIVEKPEGSAEVRETFNVPKIGTIAGCSVLDGKINRNHFLRLRRDGNIIHEGKVSSLKRFKDDVKEVKSGYECGIGIEGYNDLKAGDIIEAYIKEEVARQLK